MNLTANMAGAWAQRHDTIRRQLLQTDSYPAFYTAEHVEQLKSDIVRASENYRRWAVEL